MRKPFNLSAVIDSQNSTLLGDYMAKGTGGVTAGARVLVDPKNDRSRISWAFHGRPVPTQEISGAV